MKLNGANMFLSQNDIVELTGYKKYKCQARWLKTHGFKFFVGYDGKPKVTLSHIDMVMGASKSLHKKVEPDENALRKHLGLI